jgi:hypothetical protein
MWVQQLWWSFCVQVRQWVTEGQGKVGIVFWFECIFVAVV